MILGIYCAGSLGKEIYDICTRINKIEERWRRIVFLDDLNNDKMFYDVSVFRPEELCDKAIDLEVVIADGTPINRKKLRRRVEEFGYNLTNIIDPTAIVSPTAVLGKGIIITPYSAISSDAVIGDNVLIQSYVRIGHDISIGADSVISANVGIGGKTTIGTRTYVGLGAVIRDGQVIGDDVIISMGAVVHTDINDGVTVVAMPARISKKNEDGIVFRKKE